MKNQTRFSDKTIFYIIAFFTVALPVLFFTAIKSFQLEGLPVYFSQLGLYALFFGLAYWGIKKSGIRLHFSFHTLFDALFFLVLAWLIYIFILSVTRVIHFNVELQALQALPAWKVWANILSTWIFVGIAEEILFRGYILNWFNQSFTRGNERQRTLLAVLVSSFFFAVWHLPVRIYELMNGESSPGLILLSIAVLFVLSIGFAWLYIRTGNILLVGLVHGVMDYPLLGGNSQLTVVILIAAIGCVEFYKLRQSKTVPETGDEDVE